MQLTPFGCSNRRTPTTSGERTPIYWGADPVVMSFFAGFVVKCHASRHWRGSVHSYSLAQKSSGPFWAVFRGQDVGFYRSGRKIAHRAFQRCALWGIMVNTRVIKKQKTSGEVFLFSRKVFTFHFQYIH